MFIIIQTMISYKCVNKYHHIYTFENGDELVVKIMSENIARIECWSNCGIISVPNEITVVTKYNEPCAQVDVKGSGCIPIVQYEDYIIKKSGKKIARLINTREQQVELYDSKKK
jgi:hypothetical protein